MTLAPFRRLMGLETEYALCSPADLSPASLESGSNLLVESQRDAYDAISESLRQRLPCAEADIAHSGKSGLFLATGGAVWFESLLPSLNVGLIEGATPECFGPRQAVACSRAQDRLLMEAAAESDILLLKNDSDAAGNAYGAQENYEIEVFEKDHADSFAGNVFVFLVGLFALVTQLAVVVLLLSLVVTVPFTAMIYRFRKARGCYATPRAERAGFDYWVGRTYRTGWNGADIPLGGWTARLVLTTILIGVFPLSLFTWIVVMPTRLGKMHDRLAPFLATRLVFAGAGRVDRKGNFHLSDKAFSKRLVAGIAEYAHGFFSLGQVIKPILSITRTTEVFKRRQRVQISVGDSNLCEEAEYLKVGATALVIDAIESGYFEEDPIVLRRPVAALHRFDRNPSLDEHVSVKGRGRLSALQIQRLYWKRCRKYVDDYVATKPETEWGDRPLQDAEDVLSRWDDVLLRLEKDPESLIGRVDWVTKKFLIEQTRPETKAAEKKIDLRYHELGPDGYFTRFSRTDYHVAVLEEHEIERATRLPPPNSPATRRAVRIREYSKSGQKASWST